MTLKAYIWGIRIISLLSVIFLGIVIAYIDPRSSGLLGVALFYLVIFFVLSGMFNLLLLFLRRKFLGNEVAVTSVGLSFRQGILLAISVVGILILQSVRMLIWWDALLVIGGVFLIELFFLSRS